MKQLAFEIWLFIADRNCAETHRRLQEEFLHPETGEILPVPSSRQIQNWMRDENWVERGNDRVRETAPLLAESQLARLWVLTDQALTVAADIVNGKYLDHPKTGNVAVMSDMVKHLTNLRGLGTAGALGGPVLEVKVTDSTRDELKTMDADARAEWMKERILKGKQMKKLTGANPRRKTHS